MKTTLTVLLITLVVALTASAQQFVGYTNKTQNTNTPSTFVNGILKKVPSTNTTAVSASTQKAVDPETATLKKQLEQEKLRTSILAEHAKQARQQANQAKAEFDREWQAAGGSRFNSYSRTAGFGAYGRDMSSWPTAGAGVYGGYRGGYYPYNRYECVYPTHLSTTTWRSSAGVSVRIGGGCRSNHRHTSHCH